MAARNAALSADKETAALKKLQASAGLMEKSQAERLDWMYEQSAAQLKKTDEELMNMPVAAQKDKDLEDVKALNESTAGSLFLRSATRTSEDMLRKLREDPLFQIKRQEQAARESMMQNPLVVARMRKKEEKVAKKAEKKQKKAAKKEKKRMKKAAKKEKKAEKAAKKGKKPGSSSSSSSSDSSASVGAMAAPVRPPPREDPSSRRGRSEERPAKSRRGPESSPPRSAGAADARSLGPSSTMVSKREEYEAMLADRKNKALASRGAPRRMSEEEKQRKFDEMKRDAKLHERKKEERIAGAERREKEQEEMEARMRQNSDQKYFKEMRAQAYMDENASMADRLRTQKHRRQKHLNDPLERDQ